MISIVRGKPLVRMWTFPVWAGRLVYDPIRIADCWGKAMGIKNPA
jgi:hypothetical protein